MSTMRCFAKRGAWLCRVMWFPFVLFGCTSQTGLAVSSVAPSDNRIACLSDRCSQIAEALELSNVKTFRAFTLSLSGPSGIREFTPLINSFAPTLLIVPKGSVESFTEFSVEKLELSEGSFENLKIDIERIASEGGSVSRGETLISDLTSLHDSIVVGEKLSGMWISGSEDLLGPNFLNRSVLSESKLLLGDFFTQVGGDELDISLDDLIANDPDVIVYTDSVSMAASPEQINSDPRWKELRAVKTGRVIQMPNSDLQGYGPADYRTFFEATRNIYR